MNNESNPLYAVALTNCISGYELLVGTVGREKADRALRSMVLHMEQPESTRRSVSSQTDVEETRREVVLPIGDWGEWNSPLPRVCDFQEEGTPSFEVDQPLGTDPLGEEIYPFDYCAMCGILHEVREPCPRLVPGDLWSDVDDDAEDLTCPETLAGGDY